MLNYLLTSIYHICNLEALDQLARLDDQFSDLVGITLDKELAIIEGDDHCGLRGWEFRFVKVKGQVNALKDTLSAIDRHLDWVFTLRVVFGII